MVENLSQSQISTLQELFDKIAPSGAMGVQELGPILRSFGLNPTESEIQDLINDLDISGNGTIDFPEFLALLCRKLQGVDTEEELSKTFEQLTGSSSNGITQAQFASVIKEKQLLKTQQEIEEMFTEADIDGDGVISYDDFSRIMMAK